MNAHILSIAFAIAFIASLWIGLNSLMSFIHIISDMEFSRLNKTEEVKTMLSLLLAYIWFVVSVAALVAFLAAV